VRRILSPPVIFDTQFASPGMPVDASGCRYIIYATTLGPIRNASYLTFFHLVQPETQCDRVTVTRVTRSFSILEYVYSVHTFYHTTTTLSVYFHYLSTAARTSNQHSVTSVDQSLPLLLLQLADDRRPRVFDSPRHTQYYRGSTCYCCSILI